MVLYNIILYMSIICIDEYKNPTSRSSTAPRQLLVQLPRGGCLNGGDLGVPFSLGVETARACTMQRMCRWQGVPQAVPQHTERYTFKDGGDSGYDVGY